jgi:predicted nucleotide-binding protein
MTTDATDPAVEAATIFVVHGHNDALRQNVARWLQTNLRSGFSVVMLDAQPSEGRTLIDKFEHHAGKAAYVVVLMTADDVGGPKRRAGEDDAALVARLQPRARQNVVFELGYFAGHLGRARVAVLYEGGWSSRRTPWVSSISPPTVMAGRSG